MQLSDVIKKLEDEGLIGNVEICNNATTGHPEMHIWFNKAFKAKDIIKSFNVSGITETKDCVFWE